MKLKRIDQGVARSRAVAHARRSSARRMCVVALAATLAVRLLAGCSTSSLSETRDAALTEAIRTGMQRASIPGAIVGVWQDGHAPYMRSFGVRDTASGQPMATDLYMRIGSVTKTFVVTAVLQLVDQGKVGLDDPIDQYVPDVPNGEKITIRQLAAMRSGLYDYTPEIVPNRAAQEPERQWTPQELLAISFRRPLVFAPGTEFDYANINTVLLGLVVEKASGQALSAYIDEQILQPEGMTRTVFPTGAAIPSPHAEGYTNWGQPASKTANATDWNPSWGWAAGAMISTLDDLRIWTRDVATGTLLTPALQRQRAQFLPAPAEGQGAEYGLALENQNGWIGHNGNIAGYMTYPYYLPSKRTTIVVMLNANVDVLSSWKLIGAITQIISPDNLWPNPPADVEQATK